jgi:hypothetical protein
MRNWNGDYGAGNTTKMQHESMAPSPFYGQTQFWNEQSSPFHPSQQLELHEPKYMGGHNSYNIGNVPIGGGNDNPQHWGRSEINQTTPWDVNGMLFGLIRYYYWSIN